MIPPFWSRSRKRFAPIQGPLTLQCTFTGTCNPCWQSRERFRNSQPRLSTWTLDHERPRLFWQFTTTAAWPGLAAMGIAMCSMGRPPIGIFSYDGWMRSVSTRVTCCPVILSVS